MKLVSFLIVRALQNFFKSYVKESLCLQIFKLFGEIYCVKVEICILQENIDRKVFYLRPVKIQKINTIARPLLLSPFSQVYVFKGFI